MAFALHGCAGKCNKYNTIQYNTIHHAGGFFALFGWEPASQPTVQFKINNAFSFN
jgi:hypothetical protein